MPNLNKIIDKIYKGLYERSTPTANYLDLKSGKLNYLDFYLSQDVQKEIIEKHTKGLSKWGKQAVNFQVYLGYSPKG
jgi:hypothetical protein